METIEQLKAAANPERPMRYVCYTTTIRPSFSVVGNCRYSECVYCHGLGSFWIHHDACRCTICKSHGYGAYSGPRGSVK